MIFLTGPSLPWNPTSIQQKYIRPTAPPFEKQPPPPMSQQKAKQKAQQNAQQKQQSTTSNKLLIPDAYAKYFMHVRNLLWPFLAMLEARIVE